MGEGKGVPHQRQGLVAGPIPVVNGPRPAVSPRIPKRPRTQKGRPFGHGGIRPGVNGGSDIGHGHGEATAPGPAIVVGDCHPHPVGAVARICVGEGKGVPHQRQGLVAGPIPVVNGPRPAFYYRSSKLPCTGEGLSLGNGDSCPHIHRGGSVIFFHGEGICAHPIIVIPNVYGYKVDTAQ